jgi:hypothetical protein
MSNDKRNPKQKLEDMILEIEFLIQNETDPMKLKHLYINLRNYKKILYSNVN